MKCVNEKAITVKSQEEVGGTGACVVVCGVGCIATAAVGTATFSAWYLK